MSSARSITFALQASISGNEDMEVWYKEKQEILKKDKEARFFVEARNLSQKIGYYPITGGRMYKDEDGSRRLLLYFDFWNFEELEYIPEDDVLTVSERFFIKLLEIVQDCYIKFGYIIDPKKYYTVEKMNRLGKTANDLLIENGYPKGWIYIETLSEREQLEKLVEFFQSRLAGDSLDWLFTKYLGTDGFGKRLKNSNKKKQNKKAQIEKNGKLNSFINHLRMSNKQ